MRLSSLAAARPAYYDRNATSVLQSYAAIIAPAGYTIRWTYTCPTGKKAVAEAISVRLWRQTAATTLGTAYGEIRTVVGTDYQINTFVLVYDNSLTTSYFNACPTQATLYAGEQLTAATNDTTTGGTIAYVMAAKLTQYDA